MFLIGFLKLNTSQTGSKCWSKEELKLFEGGV